MLKWGDGTLYHYKLLARLNALASFLDSPVTWYALTGRREGVPRNAPAPPD
jgi:hypothetical protein